MNLKNYLIYSLLFVLPLIARGQTSCFYLHTDKDSYLPGEIIWFKAYHIDCLSGKLYPSKSMVSVIFSSEKQTILSTQMELGKDLAGAGSFLVPQHLSSGAYSLNVYNSAAVLSNKEDYFKKRIEIINPFTTENQESKARFKFDVQGGKLIDGIPAKIQATLASSDGLRLPFRLVISGQKNNLQVESDLNGVASFDITPSSSENVEAKILIRERLPLKVAFPKVYAHGAVLQVSESAGEFHVNVMGTSNFYNKTLTIESSNRQVQKIVLNSSGKAHLNMRKSTSENEVESFMLKSEKGQILSQQIVPTSREDSLLANLKLDSEVYKTRETANLTIQIPSENIPVFTSISVRRLDNLMKKPSTNLLKTISRQSAINSTFVPSDLFPDSNSKPGLNRYNPVVIQYLDKQKRLPLINERVLLSVAGADDFMSSAVTDSLGIARFYVRQIYGNVSLATIVESGIEVYPQLINPDLSDVSTEVTISKSAKDPAVQKLIASYAVNVQAENRFRSKEKSVFYSGNNSSSGIPFYGRPDVTYQLDDYTRFSSMEEVFREYIKEVRVRKNRDNFSLRVLDKGSELFLNDEPLVLFDGVPLNSCTEIMEHDPLKIKQVDIVASKFNFRDKIYSGIVSFKSYKKILDGFKMPASVSLIPYEGIQPLREFYMPDYTTEISKRIPDTRNVLYWNPNLKISDSGSASLQFSTSDLTGNFIIDIQGIDNKGKIISSSRIFRVE